MKLGERVKVTSRTEWCLPGDTAVVTDLEEERGTVIIKLDRSGVSIRQPETTLIPWSEDVERAAAEQSVRKEIENHRAEVREDTLREVAEWLKCAGAELDRWRPHRAPFDEFCDRFGIQ